MLVALSLASLALASVDSITADLLRARQKHALEMQALLESPLFVTVAVTVGEDPSQAEAGGESTDMAADDQSADQSADRSADTPAADHSMSTPTVDTSTDVSEEGAADAGFAECPLVCGDPEQREACADQLVASCRDPDSANYPTAPCTKLRAAERKRGSVLEVQGRASEASIWDGFGLFNCFDDRNAEVAKPKEEEPKEEKMKLETERKQEGLKARDEAYAPPVKRALTFEERRDNEWARIDALPPELYAEAFDNFNVVYNGEMPNYGALTASDRLGPGASRQAIATEEWSMKQQAKKSATKASQQHWNYSKLEHWNGYDSATGKRGSPEGLAKAAQLNARTKAELAQKGVLAPSQRRTTSRAKKKEPPSDLAAATGMFGGKPWKQLTSDQRSAKQAALDKAKGKGAATRNYRGYQK